VTSIPVVTSVSVAWPVSAKAYEDEFAMVIRPEIANCIARSPGVTNGATTVRPGYPEEYPAIRIIITMVVINTPAGDWIVVRTLRSNAAVRAGSSDRLG